MSSEAHDNLAYSSNEKDVMEKELAKEGSGGGDGLANGTLEAVDMDVLDPGVLKLSGITYEGQKRQSDIVKSQDLDLAEATYAGEEGNFWTSMTCRIIAIVILVLITAGFIVMCVCMGGHCESSDDDDLVMMSTALPWEDSTAFSTEWESFSEPPTSNF